MKPIALTMFSRLNDDFCVISSSPSGPAIQRKVLIASILSVTRLPKPAGAKIQARTEPERSGEGKGNKMDMHLSWKRLSTVLSERIKLPTRYTTCVAPEGITSLHLFLFTQVSRCRMRVALHPLKWIGAP